MKQGTKQQKKKTKISEPMKPKTIFDMVEEFGPSNIDPKADLIKLYYEEKGKKYGW